MQLQILASLIAQPALRNPAFSLMRNAVCASRPRVGALARRLGHRAALVGRLAEHVVGRDEPVEGLRAACGHFGAQAQRE